MTFSPRGAEWVTGWVSLRSELTARTSKDGCLGSKFSYMWLRNVNRPLTVFITGTCGISIQSIFKFIWMKLFDFLGYEQDEILESTIRFLGLHPSKLLGDIAFPFSCLRWVTAIVVGTHMNYLLHHLLFNSLSLISSSTYLMHPQIWWCHWASRYWQVVKFILCYIDRFDIVGFARK